MHEFEKQQALRYFAILRSYRQVLDDHRNDMGSYEFSQKCVQILNDANIEAIQAVEQELAKEEGI